MSNKTCGECKHFEVDVVAATCEKKLLICDDKAPACTAFEPKPTNGDVIRQMSDKNLAIFLGDRVYCFTCPAKGVPCFDKPKDVCYQKWFDWLNAPAESEGEDE